MSSSKLVSPDKVTNKEFAELLASYEPLIDSISASKGAKSGQKTLQELDQFRFVEAPALFSQEAPKRSMNHDDVKVLVDWKLRHGKFRPTLMKLVSSNDSSTAEKTVKEGVEAYQGVSDLSASLNILTRLKGIGPATASLLLAVHYPEQVLFFSDEAYYWLCNKGQKASLKYNMKEYESLNAESRKLMKRLDVSAMDIEKVAYVLLKQEGTASVAKTSSSPKATKDELKGTSKAASSKRKKSTDEMVEDKGPTAGAETTATSVHIQSVHTTTSTPTIRRSSATSCATRFSSHTMDDELFEGQAQFGAAGDMPPPQPPDFSSMPYSSIFSQYISPYDTPSLLWSQSFPPAMDNRPRGFMRADEIFSENGGPIPLPPRFAQIKRSLIAGKETAIVDSWNRLLVALRAEIALIGVTKSDIIPTIDFSELKDHARVSEFAAKLRRRGGAVIRNVIPPDQARNWREETETYLADNPETRGWPTRDPHLFGIYWSPAQIKGRAHPNVLVAQRFLMGLWRSRNPNASVAVDLPVAYADRLRIRAPGDEFWHLNAHVDGGSVERWESDGYGNAGTYQRIWDGKWEDYDPWESSTRLKVTSDLYNGAGSCSMFRMFQGWLSMSDINPTDGTLLLCPMLQLATAYFLLRPFFSPLSPSPEAANFLARENWSLDFMQTSIIQGAVPSYTQELNASLHPHLQLDKSLVRIPPVRPGDYVVWHPDMVYGVDKVPPSALPATIMYIPACPLTQTNALYLARQRKAFLLGQPSPDFGGGRGETSHLGRPGVQEVSDAGGEDGLRAMGLLPWEDREGRSPTVKTLVGMANAILFPDQYDMV
ncbi:hypothetical protein GCG54_00000308 [Colletotrichum gloeosporioides]|uniref:DUF1479 domain-containing protein n=1 Tax=Colletotrichum gloeosporioides TaxID=474922 RepID=A0A8H4FIC8_COLGL|nr:uncharacterized protein GCG54_00000308 [Colletotrichum gloeosporioides]KAF3802941.1 hypothetical protein GCG54_00000308 [Colletotrichum gloeosporioides]